MAPSLEALEGAIVQVESGDQRGSGFYISPRYIVTAAHVVSGAQVSVSRGPGPGSYVRVVARLPETSASEVWPAPDLAVLEGPEYVGPFFRLAQSLESAYVGGAIALGYASGIAGSRSLVVEEVELGLSEPAHGGRLHRIATGVIQHGLSGGPILNEETLSVVGITKATRNPLANLGGWSVPVAYLYSHFASQIEQAQKEEAEEAVAAYLSNLIPKWSMVEPRGMRRTLEAQDVVFPLDDIFLSLQLRSYSALDLGLSSKPGGPPTLDRMRAPYLTIDRLDGAVDDDMAGDEDAITSLGDLFSQGDAVVVLGSPGAGKSTLLQWVCLANARAVVRGESRAEVAARHIDPESVSDELIDIGPARLPVLLKLADFDEHLRAGGAAAGPVLWEYLVSQCEDRCGGRPLRYSLEDAASHGRLLVALDGMDELNDRSRREQVRAAILELGDFLLEASSLSDGEETNALVVTSRHAGYRDVPLPPDRYQHAVVQTLSDSAVRRFLFNWSHAVRKWSLQAIDFDPSQLAREAWTRSGEIEAELFAIPSLKEAARTPLMLTVITLVHDELGRLPRQRADLLGEMCRILIERRSTDVSVVDAMDVLGPVAKWIHDHRPTGLISRAELTQLVSASYDRLGLADETSRSELVRLFCVDAEQQFGLLVERGHDLIGFQHRLIQEYFAAVELTSRSSDLFAELSQHLFDPQWREIVLLSVAREAGTSAERVGTLLQSILEFADPLVQSESSGSPLGHSLLLASDCLLEVERALPPLERQIIAALFETYFRTTGWVRGTMRAEAAQRVRSHIARSPRSADAVIASLISSGSDIRRRLACELLLSVDEPLSATKAALVAADGASGFGLPERRALVHLSVASVAGSEAEVESSALSGVLQHLRQFGKSHVLAVVEDAIANRDGPQESDELLVHRVRTELLGLASSTVGIEAVLAGTSVLILGVELMGSVLDSLVSRALYPESMDVASWVTANCEIPEDGIPGWKSLQPYVRAYVITSAISKVRESSVTALAWSELSAALAQYDAGARPSPAEEECLRVALLLLAQFNRLLIDIRQFDLLVFVLRSFPDFAAPAEEILSCSWPRGLEVATAFSDLGDSPPSGLPASASDWLVLSRAEHRSLEPDSISALFALAVDRRGLWRQRARSVLAHQRTISSVGLALLQRARLVEANEAPTAPNLRGPIQVLRASFEFDDPSLVQGYLATAGSDCGCSSAFTRATPDVISELVSLALCSDNGDVAAQARSVLVDRFYAPSTESRWGGGLNDSDLIAAYEAREEQLGAELLGISCAFRLASGSPLELPDLASVADLPREVLDEMAFALSHSWSDRVPDLIDGDGLLCEVLERGSVSSTYAVAAIRLSAVTPDRGRAWLDRSGLALSEVADALVAAGAHLAPWLPNDLRSSNDYCLDGISDLVLALASESEFLDLFVASCARILDENGADNWPLVRFVVDQLVGIGTAMPDAFRERAEIFGLSQRLADKLLVDYSFGVRVRAFHALSLVGKLTPSMVGALAQASLDGPAVAVGVYRSLGAVVDVEEGSIELLLSHLLSGGLPGLGAVDVLRALCRSEAFAGSPLVRSEVLRILALALDAVDPLEACRTVGGPYLNLWPLIFSAYAVASGMQQESTQWSPHSLRTSRTPRRAEPGLAPDETFARLYLQRVRHHLIASGGGSVSA